MTKRRNHFPIKPYIVPTKIQVGVEDLALQTDELMQAHFVLKQLGKAWKRKLKITEVCQLALTTMKVLEMRRTFAAPKLSVAHASDSRELTLSPYNTTNVLPGTRSFND